MSDRLFFGTNVLLDHLLGREPFADDATELWSMAERSEVTAFVAAINFNFVYYVVRHHADERAARRAVRGMRGIFEIAAVDEKIIHQARESRFGISRMPSSTPAPCRAAPPISSRAMRRGSASPPCPQSAPTPTWPA